MFLALTGCQTTQPGSPEAVIKAAAKSEEAKVDAAEQKVSDIPDWCLNIPSSDSGSLCLWRRGII